MKTTPELFAAGPEPAESARSYLAHLTDHLAAIDPEAVAAIIREIVSAREAGQRIFIAGNGGSAATASHMVNDLAADVAREAVLEDPFRVYALTDNVALLSAIANDTGYDNIFVAQLRILFQPGDRFLAMSASGNSPNLILAARWVRDHGGRVLSFVGFDGGRLRELSDICVHVETANGEYGVVEDAHLALNHIISNWLINSFRSATAAGR